MHVAGSSVIGPERAWRRLKQKSDSRIVLAEIVGSALGFPRHEHWNPRRDVGSLTPGSMEQCREQSFVSCEHQIDC